LILDAIVVTDPLKDGIMVTVGNDDLRFAPQTNWIRLPPEVEITEAIGVAVNSQDQLFIFNRADPPVIVLDAQGEFQRAWGTGLFTRPHGIWIAADDTLYLVDDLGHSVRQFTADGDLLRTIGPQGVAADSGADDLDFRKIVRGAGPYNFPTNVVTTSSGDLFVSDGYGNARVHHFDAHGAHVKSWGQPGTQPGQFQVPHGLAVDDQNRLYVADRENSRVQIFSTQGELLDQWTEVVRPCQVFVASDQLVYIAELGNRNGRFPWMECPAEPTCGRVSIFTREGTLLCRWGNQVDATRDDAFYAAHDIWVDSQGTVYVGEVARTAAGMVGEDTSRLPTLRKFVRC